MQIQTAPEKQSATALAITNRQAEIIAQLPKFLRDNAESFFQICLRASQDPKLRECSPESVYSSVLKLAQLGLKPDGRRAALIPRRVKGRMECHADPMYVGLVDLARRSGQIKDVVAEVVYTHEIDAGDFEQKPDGEIVHRNRIQSRRAGRKLEDSAIEFAWAGMRWADGHWTYHLCDKQDLDKARGSSQVPNGPLWNDNYRAACKKTAVKRLMNLAPLPEEAQQALAQMDEDERAAGAYEADSETVASRPLQTLQDLTESLPEAPEPQEAAGAPTIVQGLPIPSGMTWADMTRGAAFGGPHKRLAPMTFADIAAKYHGDADLQHDVDLALDYARELYASQQPIPPKFPMLALAVQNADPASRF